LDRIKGRNKGFGVQPKHAYLPENYQIVGPLMPKPNKKVRPDILDRLQGNNKVFGFQPKTALMPANFELIGPLMPRKRAK